MVKTKSASPEKTATGKGISTPLIPVNLEKIETEVQTSTTLGSISDLNLRPNGGIQIPEKSKEQSLVSASSRTNHVKNYYVVFNGPYPGIYTSWDVAEQAVRGHSGVKHKKYKDFLQAQEAAKIFTDAEFKSPLAVIYDADNINPYKKALTKEATSQVTLGKVKVQPSVQWNEDFEDFKILVESNYEDFDYMYKMGRSATQINFVNDRYWTSDKNNISYINVYPGADPQMVYEAFIFGLLGIIYPAKNLLEIQLFPDLFKKVVSQFRKKCLKGDKEIFIKFQSTIFCWPEDNEECPVSPIHYVQIGAVKEKIYKPSEEMEAKLEKKDLLQIAKQKLMEIIIKLFSITKDDRIHVNLSTYNLLITSFSDKGMNQEEFSKLNRFREHLIKPYTLGVHEPSFCSTKKKDSCNQ